MKMTKKRLLALACATASTSLGQASLAQSSDSNALEEIIVTATKMSARSVQDTSIAMSVFSENSLKQKGITNIRDLEMFTPGLEVAVNGPATTLVMRGMGSQSDTSLGTPGNVAVHIDGVIVEDSGNWLAGFLDVERVEVLRGPQGTLYGRNSTSGAINIITKNPADEFEYRGSVALGDYSFQEYTATVSGPLSEQAGARFSVQKRDHDGYVENHNPGVDDGMDEDTLVANGTLSFDVSDSFRATVKADYVNQDYSPNYRPATDTNAGLLAGGTVYDELWNVNTDVDERIDERFYGASLLLEKSFGDNLTLRSITGYRDGDALWVTDFDTTEIPFGGLTSESERQTVSEELQLVGTSENFEWLVGAYYFDSDAETDNLIEIGFPDPVLGQLAIATLSEIERTAYSAFANLKYQISEKLWLNAGIRYSYEEAETVSESVTTSSNFGAFPAAVTVGDSDWDSVDPKVGLDYYLSDDVMLYGYIATGFKSGAFNTDGSPYEEESILTYEAGVKSTLLDGRMVFNASAFYNEMKDLQVLVFDPTNLASFSSIENAAEATVSGIEIDVTSTPVDGLFLTASITATDGEFDEWKDALYYDGTVRDVSGNQIPYAPELSLNLSARYTFAASDLGSLSVGADYAWVDDVRYDAFEDDDVTQDSYDTLSATIRFDAASERWSIEVFGANLTDEEAYGWMITSPFSSPGFPDVAGSVIAPRTYGVRFEVKS